MRTKIVAFDIYGTVLSANDAENILPPRTGFITFCRTCLANELRLVTSSDSDLWLLKSDLKESGVILGLFSEFCKMEKGQPKDFTSILSLFEIEPPELHVFGDRLDFDIEPAIKLGCKATLVPVYESGMDDFNFMSLLPEIT